MQIGFSPSPKNLKLHNLKLICRYLGSTGSNYLHVCCALGVTLGVLWDYFEETMGVVGSNYKGSRGHFGRYLGVTLGSYMRSLEYMIFSNLLLEFAKKYFYVHLTVKYDQFRPRSSQTL